MNVNNWSDGVTAMPPGEADSYQAFNMSQSVSISSDASCSLVLNAWLMRWSGVNNADSNKIFGMFCDFLNAFKVIKWLYNSDTGEIIKLCT